MAPSQCFQFSNLTLQGYTSDHKDSYYDNHSSSRKMSLTSSEETDVTSSSSESTDPSGNESGGDSNEKMILKYKLKIQKSKNKRREYRRKRIEERRKRREERRKGIEERRKLLAAESQIQPLILRDFIKLRHDASIIIKLPANVDGATKGPVAVAEGRVYPRSIIPWVNFPEIQVEILKKISMEIKLPGRSFATRFHLLDQLAHPKLIRSEQNLVSRQEEALTEP
ncbi:hypothetical protein E4U58_001546, partial [Claviceps cyperi]